MRNLLSFAAILLGAWSFIGASTAATAADAQSGKNAYANSCASCHSNPSSYQGTSAQSIQNAIQSNRGGMGRLASLTGAELQDIATYLANPSATAIATTGTTTGTTQPASAPNPIDDTADSDRVFDWAESAYALWFGEHSPSRNVEGYYLRYYPSTGVYLATQNARLYFYNTARPQEGMLELGALSDWLPATNSPARPNDSDNGSDSDSDGSDSDGSDSDDNDSGKDRDD